MPILSFDMALDGPARDGHDAGAEPSASEVLRALAAGDGPTISFGDLLAATGARIHGFALLIIVLPETLPLPLPSASTFLAVPLMLIALHLALFGEGSLWPARLSHIHVRRSTVAAAVRYVAPVLEWLESLSRPRWAALARRESLVGVVSLYLSLVLFLPVPFLNALPAICLALLALGLIQRDGVIIAVGLAGTAVMTAAVAWIVVWAGGLIAS